ncbi:MAG: proton-conducting transporter membrane subunit [Reichenbachiella sp.]|uniref:proton-conducting transporter transmembrane domain-containing protein n=1 Tax=Reichenbachiella sp. TaxID=2184521 RepID=UPI003299FDAA
MNIILPLFIIIPFVGFVLTTLPFVKKEKTLSSISFVAIGIQHLLTIGFTIYWVLTGCKPINIKEIVLYQSSNYEFFIDLYFDRLTMVYLLVGSLLTFLIKNYSRVYLHRESGFKRFFSTILFFYTGFCVVILSGNFETFFIGWEIVGISSFLLIAYYRDRYLPVRNAFKVFSLYRLGDVCVILAMWMSHHLWHHNVTFLEINNLELVHHAQEGHGFMVVFICIMLIVAASVKSAQFPFTSWLPRAMEGPTPSSAIFYGSLSVHIGAFLLLRTFPFWESQPLVRILVGSIGALTSIVGTYSAQVQSSVKSQIAFGSAAQIGLIFIEISLGLEVLAMIHIASNAFLRTYQLLVSPSIVTYLIRDQLYKSLPHRNANSNDLLAKIRNSIYVLSIKEWNMDTNMFHFLWQPIKKAGKLVRIFSYRWIQYSLIVIYGLGWYLYNNQDILNEGWFLYFPITFSIIGLATVTLSLIERHKILLTWILIVSNHFWIALAVSYNEHFSMSHNIIYLSGVFFSGILGVWILYAMKKSEPELSLNSFQGHVHEYRNKALLFLLAVLGLAGFPITTTFLGEDLIYSHIHEDQLGLTVVISISLIITGLSLIRMYTRIFLGPHIKTYREKAYRSS